MPRELSPEISHPARGHDESRASSAQGSTPLGYQLKDADFISAQSNEKDFRRQINYQLEQIKRRQRETDEHVLELTRSLKQTQEVQRLRSEQIKALQREVESYVSESLQKISSKFSVQLGQMREKFVSESKVQDLMDRHNQIVQRFEMRLEQLQKLMGEQDLKLLSYSDTLKEIRRQLPPRS